MELHGTAESAVQVQVENIGGIAETRVEFSPGVTVLTGRNATNRTSFLRAVMAALGSDAAAVKGDAEEGSVELTVDSETYTRVLSRRNGTTVFDGDPYLDDPEVADLFAFLLESNAARRAVERGADLYDIIMQPVDTAEIDAEISELEGERERIESELDELKSLEQRLPDLVQERTQLESDIEAKREVLESNRADLADMNTEAATPEELEARFKDLREARNDLEDVQTTIEDEERVIEALEDDKQRIETDLDGLAAVDEEKVVDLEEIVAQHRDAIQDIEAALADMQSVIQFNESLIDSETPSILDSTGEGREEGVTDSVTDKLTAEGGQVVCWTCGSRVNRSEIERTIDLLRDVHAGKIDQRNALKEEIQELESERKHLQRTDEERRQFQTRLSQIETDLEERAARIDDLRAEGGRLEQEIEDLEATIAESDADDHDELLSLHRQVTEAEFELNRLQARHDELDGEIEAIEACVDDQESLVVRREEIDEELESLRSRIERLETEVVEKFNEQMGALLDLLGYENLERIWIEPVAKGELKGQRTESRTAFDIHVVRATESGAVYEDSIDHLSESEREVVGLVFALSGFIVHEAFEQIPFMVIDSIEAFDSDRVAKLVDHFANFSDYLIVALLPEDAAALDDGYQRVTEI